MGTQIRKVSHFTTQIKNRAGEGARVLAALRDAGANFIAVWAYPDGTGAATLEMVPENDSTFPDAAQKARLKLGATESAFYISGDDRPGALADILERLAAAGVNVGAAQSVKSDAGHFGAVVYVPQKSIEKASKALGLG